jgi:hypothetical protein
MSACPQCGFSYGWDGATCGHCHFPASRLTGRPASPEVQNDIGDPCGEAAEWETQSGAMEALHAPLTGQEVVAAAQVIAGFCVDLSRWRVTISRDGRLRQEVFRATSADADRDELQQETVQLRPGDVEEVLALIDRIGFRGFRDLYCHETMIVTDLPYWIISVRFGDGVKTVSAWGPASIAGDEDNRDMAGFVALWELIHRHAPYPGAEPGAAADGPRL